MISIEEEKDIEHLDKWKYNSNYQRRYFKLFKLR